MGTSNSKAEMSRRHFVEAMGAVTAAMGFGLVGCGSRRASEAGSGSGGAADTLTFAQSADPRGLDPAFVDDGESAFVMVQIYDGLLRYAEDSCEIKPGLASEWDVSEDGLTYTLTLREGVKFHDGSDFNAEAAKRSIERQLEPNRTDDMPYASFTFGSKEDGTGIESIEAKDPKTLVIKLRAASSAFLANLAMCMAAPIVSSDALDKYNGNLNENPVGTGAYTFVSWSKSQNIVLKANKDYWDKESAPKTENLIFKFIAENASRVTALNNGEVDICVGIDDSVVKTITDAGNKLYDEDGMNVNYMAFNTESDTFKDKAARKAFAKAVDLEEMVSALYGDYASVATTVMPQWMAPYLSDIKPTDYDPDAAKKELADLGITKVKCLTYTTTRPYNGKGGQALAEAVKGYLDKVGVDVQIDSYDWTTYKTKVQTESYDICFYGWVGDNGDPDNFLNLLSDPNPAMNVARFKNDEYNELIKKGLVTPNGAERDDVYHQAEALIAEEQPWLLVSHSKTLAGYRPEVSGFSMHPTGVTFLRYASKSA